MPNNKESFHPGDDAYLEETDADYEIMRSDEIGKIMPWGEYEDSKKQSKATKPIKNKS